MNFLSAENISKNFGERQLFSELNFGLSKGQKIAMVGLNGTGKSTVLKVLAGLIKPDSGKVSFRKGIVVRFLPQEPELKQGLTVFETIFDGKSPIALAIREYETLVSNPDAPQDALERAITKMDTLKAWDFETRIKQVLGMLGVYDYERKVDFMSGGERKRVGMAKLLLEDPDLIIMDEPTNHLDIEAIEWLEKYLSHSSKTLLMVTHDRYFLNNVSEEIIELDQGRMFRYKGNYEYYITEKAERETREQTETMKAKNLLKTELEWLRRMPKARTTKSKARIESVHELKERTINKYSQDELRIKSLGGRLGGIILELHHVGHNWGEQVVLDGFTYKFRKGERLGIIGKNGCGKSTMLNILTQNLEPDKGKVRIGVNTSIGYYKQGGLKYKPGQRVIEVINEEAEEVVLSKSETISASRLLNMFLFPPAKQSMLVDKLSGGEKKRLALLKVLIRNPNFLILDEPTNDLDLVTLNVLEDFLNKYQGCLVVVSHDRHFMNKLVDHLFIFEGEGKIKDFPGNYLNYTEWKAADDQKKAKEKSQANSEEKKEYEKIKTEKIKLTFKEQREYDQLEVDIDLLETRQKELQELLNSGSDKHEELLEWSTEIQTVTADLEKKSDRWLELAEFVN